MKTLAGLFFTVLITGCAQTISINQRQAFMLYADGRSHYAKLEIRVEQLCRNKTLSEADCNAAAQAHKEIIRLDREVRKMLLEAKQDPDWEKIGQYAEAVIGMAVRAGLKVP